MAFISTSRRLPRSLWKLVLFLIFSSCPSHLWASQEDLRVDLGANRVTTIHEDDKGTIWIGTDNSLFRKDPQADEPIMIVKTGWVNAIHQDKKGTIWIAALGGLYRKDPQAAKPVMTNVRWVNAIHEDNKGTVWIAAADGLFRKDPKAEEPVNVTVKTNRLSDVTP
jgi:ligand-binding sensor domain-containing protein